MAKPLDTTPYVFVYGTLKYGYGNWRWCLQHEEYIGEGVTHDKYVLGNVGFPFMFRPIPSWPEELAKPVLGDVFKVENHSTMVSLDGLEGEGILYHRELVKVIVNHTDHTCWAYINRNSEDLSRCYKCNTTENGEWIWHG